MSVKADKFLLQYFMQVYFNEMPPEKLDTLRKYIKNGDDFPKDSHMKLWKRDLMHQDTSGKWVPNDYPDAQTPGAVGAPTTLPNPNPWELYSATDGDKEWEKLYLAFRDAFIAMDAQKSEFTDANDPDKYNKDATQFLRDYFGDPAHRMFSNVVASAEAETEIANLLGLLNNASLSTAFTVKLNEWGIISAQELKDGLKNKKYNQDSEFQSKLKRVSEYLDYYKDEMGLTGCDFSKIMSGFDTKHVNPNQLQQFKEHHKDLLRIVAKNKKIQERFHSNLIDTARNQAQNNTDYKNESSKDYLVDQPHDTKTKLQKMQEWFDDTYSNVFEKWKMAQGDRLYFSPEASQIVAALDKEKVKPTDGLAGIEKAIGNVQKKVAQKSARTAGYAKWLGETLGQIKSVMPKAYEGALSNGRQLKAVIEELIIRAVRDGKIEEAKTAMEVISVCKYGLTTSKIMDKLKKEEFTIFSDPKLSFNKGMVQDFTKAMDKTIGFGIKAVGYGITTAVNTVNKMGSRFNNHRGDRIQSEFATWDAQNTADKQAAINDQTIKNQADRNEIATLNAARTATGITDANLATKEADLAAGKQTEEQRKTELDAKAQALNAVQQTYDQKKQTKDNYEAIINKYDNEIPQKIADLQAESARLRAEYNQIKAQLGAIATPYANAMVELKARQLQDKYKKLYTKRDEALKEAQDLTQQLRTGKAPGGEYENAQNNIANARTEEANAQTALTAAQGEHQTAENDYNTIHNDNSDKESKIKTFKESGQKIQELNEQINRRNEVVNTWDAKHKNMYDELIQYWDFLEKGRDARFGNFYNRIIPSKKNAQQRFDARKMQLWQDYQNNYGSMAA